ncbi:unnamed protein product [marine sediment metagenome]|uniref:Uncharacterized protein n=1 Tax=marine sediment metagenome TaxID=412755 RepID=X0S8E8_9ZZZZ
MNSIYQYRAALNKKRPPLLSTPELHIKSGDTRREVGRKRAVNLMEDIKLQESTLHCNCKRQWSFWEEECEWKVKVLKSKKSEHLNEIKKIDEILKVNSKVEGLISGKNNKI